jgi:hypothetical protein
MKLMTATVIALALASGAAFAQAAPPAAPTAVTAVVAKFKATDKNNNGSLDGAELDAYKTNEHDEDRHRQGRQDLASRVCGSHQGRPHQITRSARAACKAAFAGTQPFSSGERYMNWWFSLVQSQCA